jgi:hypothetical protein
MNYLQVVQDFVRMSTWSVFGRRQHSCSTTALCGVGRTHLSRAAGKLPTPSTLNATSRSARIPSRDAAAIENFRKIDTLIVDKTGTLTEGQPAEPASCTPARWRPLLRSPRARAEDFAGLPAEAVREGTEFWSHSTQTFTLAEVSSRAGMTAQMFASREAEECYQSSDLAEGYKSS